MVPPGVWRLESKYRITSACCRTGFPLCSKSAANDGVCMYSSADHIKSNDLPVPLRLLMNIKQATRAEYMPLAPMTAKCINFILG
jgi:hypothetical protein